MITNNAAAGPQFYWIGLTLERKVISGIVNNTVLGFDWTDLSTYNYNNFDPTINPSNTGGGQATGEYCVHTTANGMWNDFNCQIWGIGNPGPGCCTPWMGAICQVRIFLEFMLFLPQFKALPGLECNNGGQSGGVAPKCENGWYSTVGLSGCYRVKIKFAWINQITFIFCTAFSANPAQRLHICSSRIGLPELGHRFPFGLNPLGRGDEIRDRFVILNTF